MSWFRKPSKDDAGDSREYVNKNCKEGVDPRSAWEDWGDYIEDENPKPRQKGLRASTPDEVDSYYDQRRTGLFRLTNRDHDKDD